MNVQKLVAQLRMMLNEEAKEEMIYNAAKDYTLSVFEDALRTKWSFNGKSYHDDTVALWQLMYNYIDEKINDDYYQV